MLRTSSSHKEGCEREWSIATKSFAGKDGHVKAIQAVRVEWEFSPDGRPLRFTEIPGSQFEIKADMVLLAMGFVGFKASVNYQFVEVEIVAVKVVFSIISHFVWQCNWPYDVEIWKECAVRLVDEIISCAAGCSVFGVSCLVHLRLEPFFSPCAGEFKICVFS